MPDFTSTLSSAIINAFLGLWYLIPVLIIIGFFKSAYIKGKFGEFIVNRAISKKLDKTEYHLQTMVQPRSTISSSPAMAFL